MSTATASNPPAATTRYVCPTPAGVFRWLGNPETSPERRLFELLITQGRRSVLRVPDFAAQLNEPSRPLASALFALLRHSSIVTSEGNQPTGAHSDWSGDGIAGLTDVLVSAMQPGQRMLLSTDDGFQIACAGCSAYEADVWAVKQSLAIPPQAAASANPAEPQDPKSISLYFGAARFILSSSHPLNPADKAWMSLARRMLKAYGLPSSTSNALPG